MKRKLLLGALLLGAFTANAQLLNGTFEGEAAVEGWGRFDVDGDGLPWRYFLRDVLSDAWGLTGNYAASESWTVDEGALSPDNYLISPLVEIPESGATLTFKKGYTFYDGESGEADQLSVYIITEESAPTVGDIANLEPAYNEVFDVVVPNSRAVAEEVTIDLTAYAGQEIAIAFRHHDSYNQEMIFLDDVVVTENIAGRNDALAKQFNVFPNPASSVINIANANALVQEVTIADINGRRVKSQKYNGVANAALNISELSAGAYFMTITSNKGTATKKIVKN